MLGAAQLLTGADACLALADTRGIILWRWVSSPSLGRELDRSGVIERVSFSEELIGTNGIGTALESRRVATVLGAAHYSRSFHPWACVAAPVLHPVTRRVCGAVNITCRAKDANAFLQVAIRSMTADVHAALHSAASVGQRRLLEAYLARRAKTLAPLVALNDKILISDEVSLEHALSRTGTSTASRTCLRRRGAPDFPAISLLQAASLPTRFERKTIMNKLRFGLFMPPFNSPPTQNVTSSLQRDLNVTFREPLRGDGDRLGVSPVRQLEQLALCIGVPEQLPRHQPLSRAFRSAIFFMTSS